MAENAVRPVVNCIFRDGKKYNGRAGAVFVREGHRGKQERPERKDYGIY